MTWHSADFGTAQRLPLTGMKWARQYRTFGPPLKVVVRAARAVPVARHEAFDGTASAARNGRWAAIIGDLRLRTPRRAAATALSTLCEVVVVAARADPVTGHHLTKHRVLFFLRVSRVLPPRCLRRGRSRLGALLESRRDPLLLRSRDPLLHRRSPPGSPRSPGSRSDEAAAVVAYYSRRLARETRRDSQTAAPALSIKTPPQKVLTPWS